MPQGGRSRIARQPTAGELELPQQNGGGQEGDGEDPSFDMPPVSTVYRSKMQRESRGAKNRGRSPMLAQPTTRLEDMAEEAQREDGGHQEQQQDEFDEGF